MLYINCLCRTIWGRIITSRNPKQVGMGWEYEMKNRGDETYHMGVSDKKNKVET
jgi:hypothetical protein